MDFLAFSLSNLQETGFTLDTLFGLIQTGAVVTFLVLFVKGQVISRSVFDELTENVVHKVVHTLKDEIKDAVRDGMLEAFDVNGKEKSKRGG